MIFQQILLCFGISESKTGDVITKEPSLESERDFSVPQNPQEQPSENPSVPTVDGSQIDPTLREPSSSGVRMEYRDFSKERVVKVWSYFHTFGEEEEEEDRIIAEAEVRLKGEAQTKMKTVEYGLLIKMKGGKRAVAKFEPAFSLSKYREVTRKGKGHHCTSANVNI